MAWKSSGVEEQRWGFVQARQQSRASMKELCQAFGISRRCGYKWWRRFCADGRGGLKERTRRPEVARRLAQRWQPRVWALRRRHADWGAPKLRWALRQCYRRGPWPSVATLGRWLARAGLSRRRTQRARPGPRIKPAAVTPAHRPHDVWTVDFKGSFYTADRTRVHALTVRDLATRYVLAVHHVRPREPEVGAVLRRLFLRHGLPRAVRVDNGAPFGSQGPRGWTALSAGWIKLGLRVEFSRPGCPQDNGAHEQMHRILKAATARPPARTLAAQQKRFAVWRDHYNRERPHAALGLRTPAEFYRRSPRPWTQPKAWRYPSAWSVMPLDRRGRCLWQGRQRIVGRSFAFEPVALKALSKTRAAVYFGPHLLGTLHASDLAGLRQVQWRKPSGREREGASPPPSTLPIH